MKITIRADKNYGVLTYYPACPAAEIFARIAGTKTMQTLHIDGTTYRVKFDRDPLELAKLARKPYKQKKPKDIRQFPTWTPKMTTAAYVRQFERLNYLVAGEYFPRLNVLGTAQYDPTIPLLEEVSE